MRKNNPHSRKSFEKGQAKDKKFKRYSTQLKIIFHYLQEYTATASMVARDTGIPQKCITRRKRDLEKQGRLYEVENKYCEVTGRRAWYLTTNSDLFPEVEPSKTGSNE